MDYAQNQIIEIPQKQLMADARASLSGRWGLAVPAFLVAGIISGIAGIIPFVPLLIGGPFALGIAMFSLKIARNQHADVGNIFDGFQNFGNALATYLLMLLIVILGILCFIVPGIILAFGLIQSMFILADEPDMRPTDVLRKSWEMMKGYKMDYFVLGLRFIPWFLLSILTLFIGLLWLIPYMQVTFANFYDTLRRAQNPEDIYHDDIARHMVD